MVLDVQSVVMAAMTAATAVFGWLQNRSSNRLKTMGETVSEMQGRLSACETDRAKIHEELDHQRSETTRQERERISLSYQLNESQTEWRRLRERMDLMEKRK